MDGTSMAPQMNTWRYPGGSMDCPSCGLANPPEALKCDCGYDFSAGKAADFPGWEISIAWRQKVAAFWSISWPAWIDGISHWVDERILSRPFPGQLLRHRAWWQSGLLCNSGPPHPPFGAKELPVISSVRGPRRRKQEPELVHTGGSLGLALDSLAAACASPAHFTSCMVLGSEPSSA